MGLIQFIPAGGARALPTVLAAALILAGCGTRDDAPEPGAVTIGEARALGEAGEMLDEQRLPPPTRGPTPAPVETPAPQR